MKKLLLNIIYKIFLIFKKLKNYLIQRNLIQLNSYDNNDYGYFKYRKEELEKSYQTFKKHFPKCVFLESYKLRRHCIKTACLDEKPGDFFLEFGVYKGASINFFSKYIKKNKIYGFDSFEGLNVDWVGHYEETGHKNLKGKLPNVENNVILIKGWIEKTLDEFIANNKNLSIKFIHIDTDTYQSTKLILEKLKLFLQNDCVILFDEFYNFAGWSVGEYQALIETFDENEYEYFAFSLTGKQAAIRFKKIV